MPLGPLWPDEKDANRSSPAGRHGYCPFEVALADVGRDGDLDIVTLSGENFNPTTLSILYNDGPHGKLEIEELVYATSYVANLTIGLFTGAAVGLPSPAAGSSCHALAAVIK